MRVVVDLAPDGRERVCGSVQLADDGRQRPFSGWLELLRVLEDVVQQVETHATRTDDQLDGSK
jgi:hypothetical protein